MQIRKALLIAVASVAVGAAVSISLAVFTVPIVSSTAEATPAMAGGKPCSACHSSAKPSSKDVKGKKKKRKRSAAGILESDVFL